VERRRGPGRASAVQRFHHQEDDITLIAHIEGDRDAFMPDAGRCPALAPQLQQQLQIQPLCLRTACACTGGSQLVTLLNVAVSSLPLIVSSGG
jgi:hypothetical protein